MALRIFVAPSSGGACHEMVDYMKADGDGNVVLATIRGSSAGLIQQPGRQPRSSCQTTLATAWPLRHATATSTLRCMPWPRLSVATVGHCGTCPGPLSIRASGWWSPLELRRLEAVGSEDPDQRKLASWFGRSTT